MFLRCQAIDASATTAVRRLSPLLKNTLNKPVLQTSISRWNQTKQGLAAAGKYKACVELLLRAFCLTIILDRPYIGRVSGRGIQPDQASERGRAFEECHRDTAS